MPSKSIALASEILWHFTGGPKWDERTKRQLKVRRPPDDAFAALVSILRSRELRTGAYREFVRVRAAARPDQPVGKKGAYKLGKKKLEDTVIETSPVCCVADIPLGLLDEHAKRYGYFAIGFHRTSLIKAGFNPVFYTLEDRGIIGRFHKAYAGLEKLADQLETVRSIIDTDIHEQVDELQYETDRSDLEVDVSLSLDDLDSIRSDMESELDGIKRFMAFIKTFREPEFTTIFLEREWRSLKNYSFTYDDVAMVLAPEKHERRNYYVEVLNSLKSRLPRKIPILPWESIA